MIGSGVMKKRLRRDYLKTSSLLSETKTLLRHFGLRAKKSLGQHFLIDREVLKSVTQAAELTPSDTVIEIGPGLGVLTRELAGRAGRVISVELDEKLASILRKTLSSFENVTVKSGDILKIDPEILIREQQAKFSTQIAVPFNYKVVADLPYYITSPVLRHFLEASRKPRLMVLMVQKEVAEVITARPGKMSLLSVSVQFYGEPRIISFVSADSFYPAPEVSSAILRIDLYPQPALSVSDVGGFFELVRAGFCAPRKQIINSLQQGLKLAKDNVLSLLERADIAPQRRAESLSLDEWQRLWVSTQEMGK